MRSLASLEDTRYENGQVDFSLPGVTTRSPVVAEVYVTEVLDRQEMHKRWDEGKTRSAILRGLK